MKKRNLSTSLMDGFLATLSIFLIVFVVLLCLWAFISLVSFLYNVIGFAAVVFGIFIFMWLGASLLHYLIGDD